MANGTVVSSSIPDGDLPPVDAPADDEPAVVADGGADAATEARAREMGWKPLSEYRGPPGKWQPAADFISRGENILPIVRDQNRRLAERVGKLEGEIGGLRTTAQEQLQIIKDLRDMGHNADQRGYDRAMAEIKTRQRRAVEAGDTTTYDQLVEQAEALASSRTPQPTAAEPPKPTPPQPAAPSVSAAVRDFVAQNPWWTADPFLNRKMIDRHIDVIQEGEITDEAEQLSEAKSRLMEDYPDRFNTPAPPARQRAAPSRRAAAVAAPTARQPAPAPGAPMAKIDQIQDPTERQQAREAFARTKRQSPDYTEAEYMALYGDPRADVLALQKPRSRANG